jgi:hypothetical protein
MEALPTGYPDVDEVLDDLLAAVRVDLGRFFVGMYLYGSLALGDFDVATSDIDVLVVTDGGLPDSVVAALGQTHARVSAGGSPWAARLEAAYIPVDALRVDVPAGDRFPQLEKDRELGLYPVESGWVIQLYTLREYGITVAGPDPHSLIPRIAPDDIRRGSATEAVTWNDQARRDPEWLLWIRVRKHQALVVLTLCRMLYSLRTGKVASKRTAARWMPEHVGMQWADLVEGSVEGRDADGVASDRVLENTLALIRLVAEQYQEWAGKNRP